MIAKISTKINIRTVLLCVSLILCTIEAYIYDAPIVSGIACITYLVIAGKSIGERLSSNKEIQWWGGFAILLSSISLANVIFYYLFKITPLTSIISFIIPLFFLLLPKKKTTEDALIPNHPRSNKLIYLFLLLEIILMLIIISSRSGELMPSPWIMFSPWFFILFAISTSIIVYLLSQKTSGKIMTLGIIIHFFIFYCIAAIVYKLGFGFDGFIHRATESWILQNGFISPKEPFYIGQYGLVVTLSRLSGISIQHIDIFLVPILASISIPTLVRAIFPKIWNITRQSALVISLIIPFIFFLPFNLTTPHNLTTLAMVLVILGIVGYYHSIIPFSLICMVSLYALATHPLLGAPLMCIVAGAFIQKKYQSKKITVIVCSILTLLLISIPLVMFGVQQWLNGHGAPSLRNPFTHVALFKEYVIRPFWYKADAAWYLEILYIWQYAITPIVIFFGLVGARYLRKTKITWILLSSSTGLLIGAFLLRTLFTFPDVSFHEQGNYPLRLLVGAIITLIPLSMYGVYKFSEKKLLWIQNKLSIKPHTLYILGSIKIGILLMFSLYFAYPQYNGKVYFPGFNVTEYDKKVVQTIHNQNPENNYVVLSTILTAVTSLTEYPFARYIDTEKGPQFYYSIPAGGPLYILYEEMLYQGQKRETIDKVFDLTHVDKVYFVVSWYWKNSDKIVEGGKSTADKWQSIDDKMWIFEYTRNDNSPQAL